MEFYWFTALQMHSYAPSKRPYRQDRRLSITRVVYLTIKIKIERNPSLRESKIAACGCCVICSCYLFKWANQSMRCRILRANLNTLYSQQVKRRAKFGFYLFSPLFLSSVPVSLFYPPPIEVHFNSIIRNYSFNLFRSHLQTTAERRARIRMRNVVGYPDGNSSLGTERHIGQ